MDFDWNEANRNHIGGHGISPDEVEQVVSNEPVDVTLQNRAGEQRIVQVGETNAQRILVVVTTWRGEKVRVVTAFPANARMRRLYLRRKAQHYGAKAQNPKVSE